MVVQNMQVFHFMAHGDGKRDRKGPRKDLISFNNAEINCTTIKKRQFYPYKYSFLCTCLSTIFLKLFWDLLLPAGKKKKKRKQFLLIFYWLGI